MPSVRGRDEELFLLLMWNDAREKGGDVSDGVSVEVVHFYVTRTHTKNRFML